MVSLALTHICALRTQTPLSLNFSAWNRTSFKIFLHAGQLKTQSIYIGESTAIILALFCHPKKILGFPLSCIWISESRITDWRLPAQSSVKRVKSQRRREKSSLSRNSVVQCLAARPIHVAAAARHIMETYSSEQDCTPVGNNCVFFFQMGWDALLSHLFPCRTVWVQWGHYDPVRSHTHQSDW